MTHSLLWILSCLLFAFNVVECARYSKFHIAISFTNLTKKFSTSVFNLSVANYCIGGLPQSDDGTSESSRFYRGDLVRLQWHSTQTNSGDDRCILSRSNPLHHSPWIAVIIEDKSTQIGCSLYSLYNQTISLTNASTLLFLRDSQSAFSVPETEVSISTLSRLSRRYRHNHQQGRTGEASGSKGTAIPPIPLFIALPLDMFSDLPGQLAMADTSPPLQHVTVTGDIELFADPISDSAGGGGSMDLSSSLLLLLILCVLFLLLGVLLVLARLGICFWQRLCFISVSRSSKSRRQRKLTAATKKALKKLPVKCLNQVDPLISEGFDQCAICIEVFKPHDLIRSLPCRHMYHRACIDPWLLKHRSCPLCKQNILIACGLPLTEEDMESCSGTTTTASDENSAFSISPSSSSGTSAGSYTTSDTHHCFFCPLLIRRRRRRHVRRIQRIDRRRHYFYSDFDNDRRPSSSLDEVSAPSGGRRVLGSASENSSSSITTRSVPSGLFFHGGNLTPSGREKGARFATASEEMEMSVWMRRSRGLMGILNCYGCVRARPQRCLGGEKMAPPTQALMPPPPPPMGINQQMVGNPSTTMLLYHLPHSGAFSQIPFVSNAALPSYEQATAATPAHSAFVALPFQPLVNWNPRLCTTAAKTQQKRTPLDSLSEPPPPTPPPPPPPPPLMLPPPVPPFSGSQFGRSTAKTNVVYAVLSPSMARMSVNNWSVQSTGAPLHPLLRASTSRNTDAGNKDGSGSKQPIFVDVNGSGGAETLPMAGGRHCFISSTNSSPSSPALIIQTRESPPPAYSLAAVDEKPTSTTLHPLRRAARFLATRLLSPPLGKSLQVSHLRRHHGLKPYSYPHPPSQQPHQQNPKNRTKSGRLRGEMTHPLHSSTITASSGLTRRHRHRRLRVDCHHHQLQPRVGVLAKTLELNHEGRIISTVPLMSNSVVATRPEQEPTQPAAATVVGPQPAKGSPQQRQTSNCDSTASSVSSSGGEGRNGLSHHQRLLHYPHVSPLRHTRVRSVRVTVEPQMQYHMERDAASCEALHRKRQRRHSDSSADGDKDPIDARSFQFESLPRAASMSRLGRHLPSLVHELAQCGTTTSPAGRWQKQRRFRSISCSTSAPELLFPLTTIFSASQEAKEKVLPLPVRPSSSSSSSL